MGGEGYPGAASGRASGEAVKLLDGGCLYPCKCRETASVGKAPARKVRLATPPFSYQWQKTTTIDDHE